MSWLPRSGLRVAGLIVGGVGVVFAAAGWAVAAWSPGAIAARHARMSALPSPDGVALTDLAAGREILIEGRIGRDQPRLFRDFVAFVKEEEDRNRRDDDRTFKVVDRQAPPLRIDRAGDEPVRVVNFGYRMDADTTWYDRSRFIETRYSGLLAGEAVVVHATTAAGGLEAIEVASGTRASYLQAIADGIGVAWWLGVGFVVGGAVLAAVAVALFVIAARRARRFA